MAIAVVMDWTGVTSEQYDRARGILGTAPQPGNLVHLAGPTEDGWRVIEVWESPEAMQTFFTSAAAATAFQAAQMPPVQPAIIPVHSLGTVAAAIP